jgi:EAL domain-containing protein (putative c-di-GMP-specific phosphodiesterase class I)
MSDQEATFALATPGDAGDPLRVDDGLLEALESCRFGVEYEPIVEVATGRTIAFEALARFYRADGSTIPPAKAFAWLHGAPSLLVEAELALKRLQLERAPGHTLFVNLDPDSYVGTPEAGPALLRLLRQARTDVVVEAIENLDAAGAAAARHMVAALRGAGVPFALDDVGAANGLVSFEMLAFADYLKFDRSLVRAPREPRRLAVVQALVDMSARTGARPVMEGIETTEDLDVARDLGVGLVQGYLFRDRFVCVRP